MYFNIKRFFLQRINRIARSLARIPKTVLYTWIALGALISLVSVLIFVTIIFFWFAKDLPRPGKVQRSEGFTTVILDRTGEKLYDVFQEENRIPLKNLSDAPKFLRDATIAVEDKNFYTHGGISSTGILRSLVNILVFHKLEGGSTLTQQLVKNVLLTQERTLPRKIKEAILAIQIERKYTKDEILQMYLSETPYGGPTVGVVTASDYYFGKKPSQLTLTESAFIAGLPQSPSAYSPFLSDTKAYVWRTEQVLRRMKEDGYITSAEESSAKAQIDQLPFSQNGNSSLRAPHFVAYVKELLVRQFGQDVFQKGGLTVTTSLDWALQEKAQTIVREEVAKVKNLKVGNGAAVILNPITGEILAMVGSKDYAATDSSGLQFNVAIQALRQPGSSIKPITYAAFFAKGYTPSTVLMDVDTKYPSGKKDEKEYNPKNYDLKYRGPMQMRYALGNSINTIAVKVSAMVGIRDLLRVANDMGMTTLEPTDENLKRIGLSLTLGGGEVRLIDITRAYGVFATGGMKQELASILKVEDEKGKVLYEWKPVKSTRVMKEDVAYLISDILSDNDARKDVFGLQSYLVIPNKTVAVKTGTTDDKRDNWTIGYTPSRVIGVWVGNNDNTPMNPALASGLSGAAPIWNKLMKEALVGMPDEPFKRPDSVKELEIDAYGGGLPASDRPTRKERFIVGTEPTTQSSIYKKVKVSKRDGSKLANTVEIAKGEYDEKTFVQFIEDDPVSGDGKNRWQEGIDAWVSTQSDDRFKIPKDTYEGTDEKIVVRIKKPSNDERVNTNSVEIKVEAKGIEEIKEIKLFVNDQEKTTISGNSFETTLKLDNGSYIIKARAKDSKDNYAEDKVRVGVNEDFKPTPMPTVSPTPSVTPSPTP